MLSSESDSLASGGWDNAATAFLHDRHFWTLFSSYRKSNFNSNYKKHYGFKLLGNTNSLQSTWSFLKQLYININMDLKNLDNLLNVQKISLNVDKTDDHLILSPTNHFSNVNWNWKVVPATYFLAWFLSLKENACEKKKNDFYFTSKTLLVPEKIKF